MSATRIIVDLLIADPSIGAAVYGVEIPQNAQLPCIVVNLTSEHQDMVLDGSQPGFTARVSIACHDSTAAKANSLGEAVKRSLENVRNRAMLDGNSPPAPYAIATLWKDGVDIEDYADNRTVFRRIIDWQVRWVRVDP